MKKTLLILFTSFFFVSFLYAGGDDRDQVLPLNSLNEGGTPTFLQDEISETPQPDEVEKEEVEESLLKTSNQIAAENTQDKSKIGIVNSSKTFVNNFLESDRGILILLILFVVGLILLFNFFVREKNN